MTNCGEICEVKMKRTLNYAFVALVVFVSTSSVSFAAPTKKKAAKKRTPITQPITNYACEGTDARIANNALSGDSRSEYRLSFGMQINRSSGTATIMGVSGTNLIRSGRHIMSAIGNNFSLLMNWSDSSNNSQALQIDFRNDGTFTGSTSESGTSSNPTYQMMCQLMGSEFCKLTNVYVTRKVDGTCWQR